MTKLRHKVTKEEFEHEEGWDLLDCEVMVWDQYGERRVFKREVVEEATQPKEAWENVPYNEIRAYGEGGLQVTNHMGEQVIFPHPSLRFVGVSGSLVLQRRQP